MADSKHPPEYTEIEKVQVPVEDLAIGMYVSELDRDWLDSPFLFQGFMLETAEQVAEVQRVCRFVYVDRLLSRVAVEPGRRSLVAPTAPPARATARTGAGIPRSVAVEREFEHAAKTRTQVESTLKSFLKSIRNGQSLDIKHAEGAVAECVESICQNPDAMVLLTQLKRRDAYTSEHSMNVCVLAILLGRHLEKSRAELQYLGICGLLHDIGKLKIPDRILNKPGPLDVTEDKVMRLHTALGRQILEGSPGIRPESPMVAYSHHERLDGSGYPLGIHGDQISYFTKIVAIADTYDAITSDRIYKEGLSHMEALTILSQAAGVEFDRDLAVNFVECLGIYPAGSLVEMSNGEVGMVLEVDPAHKLKPRVVMLLDADKQPQQPHIVDLAHFSLDSGGQPYRIRGTLRNRSYGLDVSRYFKDGVLSIPAVTA